MDPYVDSVRDTYGNPLQKNTNYILEVFNPDTSQPDPYYIYDAHKSSTYDWLWLKKQSNNAFAVQINNKSEVLTDGKQQYILNGPNNSGEVVRYQSDVIYNGGVILGVEGS